MVPKAAARSNVGRGLPPSLSPVRAP